MKQEIRELAALVDELRREDRDFRIFGADSHRYRTGPTLSDAEIRDFERQHGIELPEDFRLWLQIVGNGNGRNSRPFPFNSPSQMAGAGPNYGLYPLHQTVGGGRVSQPFPFETGTDTDYEIWEEDVPGAIEISTAGCSSHSHLVVSGPQFGTIWEGYEYEHFHPTHASFRAWMRNWAERALPQLRRERVAGAIEIGMLKAQAIAICGDNWTEKAQSPEYRSLHFTGFTTHFGIDENDRVIRIFQGVIGSV